VEDDPAVLRSVQALVEAHGFPSEGFRSAEEFLSAFDREAPGCLITDLRLPGINGVTLQQRLLEHGSCLSVIVISGCADVSGAVELMQKGALTLLEKPYDQESLLASIHRAIRLNQDRRTLERRRRELESRFNQLSAGEHQVLKQLLQGASNKQIAFDLQIAVRTVEYRRKSILSKLGAGSVVEAARRLAEHERLTDISRLLCVGSDRLAPPEQPR
jgi:FixJ family two-component response regulator